jgi:hypothetical protein
MKVGIHKVFILFFGITPIFGVVSAVTNYHLRMIRLIEQNRSPIEVPDDSALMEHFDGIWGIDSLEHLLASVYKLKKERDEALYFLRQLSMVAQEKDDFEKCGPGGQYYGHDSEIDKKYDALFKRLAVILGSRDAGLISREMFELKREWLENQELVNESIYFKQPIQGF